MRLKPARFASSSTLVCALFAFIPGTSHGQALDTRTASTVQLSENMLRGLQYRMIGPHRGGRVTAVAGVPGDHRTFYMGATGGAYGRPPMPVKSGRTSPTAISRRDPSVPSLSRRQTPTSSMSGPDRRISAATLRSAVAPINPPMRELAKIRIDPRDPDRVYIAAVGHAFGPNPQRGILRSRDGGKNWAKVLYVNDHTGAVDLVMTEGNPDVLYAVMWSGERHPWGMVAGSVEGGVFKTTDGGDHWTKLTGGLPQGVAGKIGVAVLPAMPNRVWALVDAADGGVFRSEDAGLTFTRINAERTLLGRSWYYGHIFADTKDPNMVYAANTDFFRSRDGGKTFKPIAHAARRQSRTLDQPERLAGHDRRQ